MLDNESSSRKKRIEHLLCANSCARCFPKAVLLNVLKLRSELGAIIPILKIEKLRLREAKQLAQGHTARNPFQAQMSSLACFSEHMRGAGCGATKGSNHVKTELRVQPAPLRVHLSLQLE